MIRSYVLSEINMYKNDIDLTKTENIFIAPRTRDM